MSASSDESKNLAIEKQKTLRLLIFILATLLLGAIGLYVMSKGTEKGGKGTVNVDFTKGKFSLSLEKPIVDQIKQETSQAAGTSNQTQFTKGIINNQEVIDQLNKLGPKDPTAYSGKNFINNELNFLLSVPHPENWQVRYNQAGLQNSMIPVTSFINQDGSNLNIGVSPIMPSMNIEQFLMLNIENLLQRRMIMQMPQVTYDFPSETAFAVFTNPYTQGESYQKVIINRARNQVFVASANYNQRLSTPETIRDLLNMITTFTLF
ncbi:MAG: hypothetical protein WCK32_04960 [Chlorobiaceae bacterium]